MESIQGSIERIRFHKTSEYSPSGNKFLIATFTYQNENEIIETTIKGEMNSVVYGWDYTLYGKWIKDDYGRAFSFNSFEPNLPKSDEGMADFLARFIPEIGKVRARAIVNQFGGDSFKILKTDPERLSEVKGITERVREAIEAYFATDNSLEIDPVAYSRLYDLLQPIRPPRRIILSLLESFGSNAPQFITENPYKLLDYPGMGWIRVDKFATEILKYDRDGIARHKAAVLEVLERNSEQGHTKTDYPTVHVDSSNLLGIKLRKDAVEELDSLGLITNGEPETEYTSLTKIYNSELSIANEIKRLMNSNLEICFNIVDDILEDEQKQIPYMVRKHPVSIISGVAGSGKSTSISVIIKKLIEHGVTKILVTCPTGKASKRNDELIQQLNLPVHIPCSTIHRALCGKPSGEADEGIPEDQARANRGRKRFSFEYNRFNKLPYEVFIIDEASMVDVSIGAIFLEAIPDASKVIIVGDHYQLPSVGPGSVLRDLMASGIPSIILDKPRRNSGVIAHACYLIKSGRNPNPEQLAREFGWSNWTHVEVESDERILETIVKTHVNYISKYGVEAAKANLQVISPEKKQILGCNNLNAILGNIVNPSENLLDPKKVERIERSDKADKSDEGESSFRKGDKIVRLKNNFVKCISSEYIDDGSKLDEFNDKQKTYIFDGKLYYISECFVVNGDGGEIIGFKNNDIIVRFANPDRLCVLPKSDHRIALAYALTVHKMQGSSAPVIITPLSDFYWNMRDNTGLYSRELLYTLFSRPSERLITIGRISEAYKAISRVTINQRKTRLKEMLNGFKC